jgi:hypothetical protein
MEEKRESSRKVITRRHFIKGAAFSTLGLAFPFLSADPVSRLVLVRDENAVDAAHTIDDNIVAQMIDTAMQHFSGETDIRSAWRKYIKPTDTVGVKITRCRWMRIPTEEAVVEAIVKRVRDIGIAENRIHTGDYGLPVEQCTVLINVPSVKVHSLTGLASSIKNYINFSDNPRKYHHGNNEKLGEIWNFPKIKGKTRLVITDLLRPYFGPGPQINPAHRWDYKGILVSSDPVASETVCLSICQQKRDLFKGESWPITPPPLFIAAADKKYGLGTSDPHKIKLKKLGWQKDILI